MTPEQQAERAARQAARNAEREARKAAAPAGGAEDTPEDRQPTIIAQVEADGTVIGLTNGLTMKTPDLIVLVDGRNAHEGPAAALARDPAIRRLFLGGRGGSRMDDDTGTTRETSP